MDTANMPPAFVLPAGDRALVQAEGGDDGLGPGSRGVSKVTTQTSRAGSLRRR